MIRGYELKGRREDEELPQLSAPLTTSGVHLEERRRYSFYVYILLCADGSYYTGYSNDPAHRFGEHLSGHGARYTRMHRPSRIVYVQGHKTRKDAMIRERRIKTLSHEEKRRLIEAAT